MDSPAGLGAYKFFDEAEKERIFTLVPDGRMMTNVDSFQGHVVNILDFALRSTEILLMRHNDFRRILHENPLLLERYARVVVEEHESDMEDTTSTYCDPVAKRLSRLLAVLVFRDAERDGFDFAQSLRTWRPEPIPFDLTVSEWEKPGRLSVDEQGRRVIKRSAFSGIGDRLSSGGPKTRPKISRRKAGGV